MLTTITKRVMTNFSIRLKGPKSQRQRKGQTLAIQERTQNFFKDYYSDTNAFYKNGFTPVELKNNSEMTKRAFSLQNATPNEIMKYRIQQAVKKYQRNVLDHGNAAIQCASISEKIIFMMNHTKKYPNDTKGARALARMIQTRRKLLNYCMRTDYHRYKWVCVDYGIPDVFAPNGLHKEHWMKNNQILGY